MRCDRRTGTIRLLAAVALLLAVAAPAAAQTGARSGEAGGVAGETPGAGRADFFRLILVPQDDGAWVGVQMVSLRNTGGGPLASLRIPLPPAVTTIEGVPGTAADGVAPEGDMLVDRRPLPAGESRDLIFTYTLPPAQTLRLALPLPYGAGRVEVFTPEGVTLVADALAAGGAVQIGDRTYRRFSGGSLAPGSTLRLSLTAPAAVSNPTGTAGADLPGPPALSGAAGAGGTATEAAGSAARPDADVHEIGHTHGGTPLKAVLNLGFIATALGAAMIGTATTGRRLLRRVGAGPADNAGPGFASGPVPGELATLGPAPVGAATGGAGERRWLIARVAALDLVYREGGVSEAAYRKVRARLIAQIQGFAPGVVATGGEGPWT